MDFKLHRLNITGALDELNTPVLVIVKCLRSHGVEADWDRIMDCSDIRYRRKCIQKLMDSPHLTFQYKRDIGRAVRYINHQTSYYNSDNIIKSLNHLKKWENLNFDNIVQKLSYYSNHIGEITEENPEGWDITILYRLCKQRGLQTDPGDTISSMYRKLTIAEMSGRKVMDFIIDRISIMDNIDIINNLWKLIPDEFGFTSEEFYSIYSMRRNITSLDFQKPPSTNHEAVILAAKEFKLNIHDSENPIREYMSIIRGKFPTDPYLQEVMKKDSLAFNIDQRFSIHLPEYVYWKEDLKRMALEEGWEGRGNPYEYLKNNYNSCTFFSYGKGPLSGVVPENQYLPIEYTNISDEDKNSMVLYGSRNDITRIKIISWRELSATFSNYREFRNPLSDTPQLFPPYAIKKLLLLARKPSADQNIANQRKTLISTIEKINLDKKLIEDKLSNLKHQLDIIPNFKTDFETLFHKLYNLSLAMRSIGNSEFDGGDGVMDPVKTEQSVSNHLIDLNSYMESLPEYTRETFLNLPLVIYYSKTGIFSTSENSFDGFSIGGRLKIIYEGDTTNTISSCLRLSSNWFLSSVYYYQTFMELTPSFDIINLVHIG